jgi:Protein of unknown function (DUF4080)/Radical SAM superfamily/B12 binding domain
VHAQSVPLDRIPCVNSPILLTTLNAKYIHASLGLRYLAANMARHGGADLAERTVIREFVIAQRPIEIVESLLAMNPAIVGFGAYIWNVTQTTQVVRLLKALRPEITIIVGGPEVSYEVEQQAICVLADHVITGWGDVSFPKLCRSLTHGPKPLMKVIAGEQPPLDQIEMPYAYYSDEDLAKRLLYVEASRGCPFKCEFCLSSLDKTAWPFDLDAFLAQMDALYARGARHFKFVDRTFNLKVDTSVRILQFFLDRMGKDLFVHFEVVPDQLHERLKELIAQFPAGTLQFEVGIQTLNPEVQQRISRKQDHERTRENIRWLINESRAHLHTDLIFGLPGESIESFAKGFDELWSWQPHEIQFGILKRLRGTPVIRHTDDWGMVYDPEPPYTVLQTAAVSFDDMQRIQRFARYWEIVANSGRYAQSLALLLAGPSAFFAFLSFSDWLWANTDRTHQFSPERMIDLLFKHLSAERDIEPEVVRQALLADYTTSGARGMPECLKGLLDARMRGLQASATKSSTGNTQRQERHQLGADAALREQIQKAAAAA